MMSMNYFITFLSISTDLAFIIIPSKYLFLPIFISNRIISNIIISNIAVRVAVVLFIVGVKPLKLYPLYTVFLKG